MRNRVIQLFLIICRVWFAEAYSTLAKVYSIQCWINTQQRHRISFFQVAMAITAIIGRTGCLHRGPFFSRGARYGFAAAS